MVNFASPLKIPKLESFQLQKFCPLTPRPGALPLDPVEGSALRPRYTLTLRARRGPPPHFSNSSCVYAMNAPGMFDCWNLDVQNDIGFDYKQFCFISAVSAEQCDARWCPTALPVLHFLLGRSFGWHNESITVRYGMPYPPPLIGWEQGSRIRAQISITPSSQSQCQNPHECEHCHCRDYTSSSEKGVSIFLP